MYPCSGHIFQKIHAHTAALPCCEAKRRSLGCSSRSPSVPPSAPEQRIKATLNSVTRHYQRNCIIELKTESREVADKKEKKVVIKKKKKENTSADITARAATVCHAAAGARDLKIPAQY